MVRFIACAGLALGVSTIANASTATSTFENGFDGWVGPIGDTGLTFIDPDGNPGSALRTIFNDFGITFRTTTNPGFVRDLSSYSEVTFSMDVRANAITTFGGQQSIAPWLVEFRDYDNGDSLLPYDSVWFLFTATLNSADHGDWTTFSVTFDATAAGVPDGWGGFGDETPQGEPFLPATRTFSDILATYDELAITTLQPGYSFPFQNYDISIDNVSLRAVPAPGAGGALVLLGLSGATARRRRA